MFADLLERCLVVAFEQSEGYWRLSRPLRNWYDDQPIARVDGVEVIPRISFSTVRLGDPGVGIAFDTGYLNRLAQRTLLWRFLQVERINRRRTFTIRRVNKHPDGVSSGAEECPSRPAFQKRKKRLRKRLREGLP